MNADVLELREQVDSLRAHIKELEVELRTYASRDYVEVYIDNYLKDLIPARDNYSEKSLIVGYKPLNIDRILKHLTYAMVYYNTADWRTILLAYDVAAKSGNIDPYIAVAHMLKETDWGRSWWSMRPRRNPIKLGVSEEISLERPINAKEWSLRNDGAYIKGHSFPSWEISAMAHIGHLLGYLYKKEALASDQLALVTVDPCYKEYASVKVLKDLDAFYVEGYGKTVATLANAIKQ
jgi:hypothetical protein